MKGRIKPAVPGMILLIAGLLAGCTKFDACAYTQAILDVSYKNQTEDYMDITGASQEEADAVFQKNLDTTMQEFKTIELPEELEADYRILFEDTVKQVKYAVGEAQESEDGGFTVDVSIEPLLLFDDTYEEFQAKAEAYAEGITNDVMNGADMPSEEEIQENIYRIYYEVLRAGLNAGVHYGTAENITVHIKKTEDGIYEIPAEDIQTLDAVMISQEKLG